INVFTGTSTPISRTSKPLMSSMKVTMFFPISCRSPCTVPISTFPSFLASSPGSFLISGLATAPMFSSISPASTSSGKKYSPSSKRFPTTSIAARHNSSTRMGFAPSSSSMRLASATASSSRISASHSTRFFSCSVMFIRALPFLGPWFLRHFFPQARFRDGLRQHALVLVPHQVHATHALDVLQRGNDLQQNSFPLGRLVRRARHATKDVFRNVHSRNMLRHPPKALRITHDTGSDEDPTALVQTSRPYFAHE